MEVSLANSTGQTAARGYNKQTGKMISQSRTLRQLTAWRCGRRKGYKWGDDPCEFTNRTTGLVDRKQSYGQHQFPGRLGQKVRGYPEEEPLGLFGLEEFLSFTSSRYPCTWALFGTGSWVPFQPISFIFTFRCSRRVVSRRASLAPLPGSTRVGPNGVWRPCKTPALGHHCCQEDPG